MFEQWSIDDDMSHGFVVPIVVLWIVWRERERWQGLPAKPSWWGLVVLAAGAVMQILAVFGGGLFAASVAFLVSVQTAASRIAAAMLGAAGVAVVREGNILDVAGHRVSVQEACNGLRYLLALGFIAVVYAYLADSKPWMRVALLAVVAPIAIFANALRVAVSGLVPALDAGTPHAVAGYLVFVLCVAILILMRGLFHTVYTRYHA
jgi:exosortase/archaeosortase family protein